MWPSGIVKLCLGIEFLEMEAWTATSRHKLKAGYATLPLSVLLGDAYWSVLPIYFKEELLWHSRPHPLFPALARAGARD